MTDPARPCPECGSEATKKRDESHSLNLYRHTDDWAQCFDCGHWFAYRGRGEDAERSFAFYDAEAQLGALRPPCPEHDCPMQPTKVWPSEERAQFKCREGPVADPCQRLTVKNLKPPDELDS